jgi:hypothetical protein
MSLKQRASRLEMKAILLEYQAFDDWLKNLTKEEQRAFFSQTLSSMAEQGLAPPFPEGLWSLPQSDKEAYLEAIQEQAGEPGRESIVRASWRSALQEAR